MRPLDGTVIVSVEQAVAAPLASRHLADLGARVIKIERPSGDFARMYDESVRGQSSYFIWLNRNKESIRLDLALPEDRAVVLEMVARADIFIQNLAPGAIKRLMLDYDTLKSVNPKIIYASISGYGLGGPYEHKKAYDLLVACEAGLVSITGTESEPARVGISVADIATGMYTYSGILSALLLRERTGEGQHLQISLLDALGEWMGQPYLYTQYGGSQPSRSGASHSTIAPYGQAQTTDGAIFFSVQNPGEWVRFCLTVLQQNELIDHELYRSNDLRVQNRQSLDTVIHEALSRLSTQEVLQRLDSAGVANAELRDMMGFSEHPQLAFRNRWATIDTEAGKVRVLKPAVETDAFEYRFDPVPRLGEHDDQLRSEFAVETGRTLSFPALNQ